MKLSKKRNTLAFQIRKKISNRITTCMLLILSGILLLTGYDIANSISRLKETLDDYCQPLEDFVISQVLVPNYAALNLKVSEFNKDHSSIKLTWINDHFAPNKVRTDWSFPFLWTYYYPLRSINNDTFGYFKISGSLLQNSELISKLWLRVFILLSFYLLVYVILHPLGKTIPRHVFIEPIHNLLKLLEQNKDKSLFDDSSTEDSHEFIEIKRKIMTLLALAESNSKQAAFGELAVQVAHDIRSPLAALKIIVSSLSELSEDKRLLIRSVEQRINDIVNNLLTFHGNKLINDKVQPDHVKPEMLCQILESIVSEKRILLRDKHIKICEDIAEESFALFVKISSIEFKRVISNIINNSCEAIDGAGYIKISVKEVGGFIQISICDNGRGIPEEFISKVTSQGFTFGKENGSGLGLSHALNHIRLWNGNLDISSASGCGTTLNISLPRCEPLGWFASKINLFSNTKIIILDDDESIHQVWEQRFRAIQADENNINIINFYNSKDIFEYSEKCSEHVENDRNILYLIDYELIGETKNGLDVIEKLKITNNTYLVTSRYDDDNVIRRCEQLNVKIIPKSYSVRIPINIESMKNVDLIFIDDDDLLTTAWQNRAQMVGLNIATFNCVNHFLSNIKSYQKDVPIYIDSNLGENTKGELVAKTIYEMGYRKIYLTTGYEKSSFKELPWILDVLTKDAPF